MLKEELRPETIFIQRAAINMKLEGHHEFK